MTQPEKYSFIRYLEAKRTVDDRALNHQCWARLVTELEALPRERPIQVMEVGAGVGTMVERMVEWGVCMDLDYTAVDSDPVLLARALNRLSAWAQDRGWRTDRLPLSRLVLDGHEQRINLGLLAGDLFDIKEQEGEAWDLIMAHAFLDLVDLELALPCLFSLLGSGGLFYFTLVFDGATILRPVVDPSFDSRVEACYHRSMDTRTIPGQPRGSSKAGRMLLEALSRWDASILAAGSSDWVVYPPYPGDEAYFLHHVLHFMEESLAGCADLEPRRLAQWLEIRHRQVEEQALVYIARQLDVLGRPFTAR